MIGTSIKGPNWQGTGHFQVGEHIRVIERRWAPLSQYLSLYISAIWLFLSCILYNKPVIISKLFFLSSVSPIKLLKPSLESWNPQFITSSEKIGEPKDLQLVSEVGTVLWDGVPTLHGLMLTLCQNQFRLLENSLVYGTKTLHIWCQKCYE